MAMGWQREKKEREKQQEEEEGEATMVKEDIRSGLEGSKDKATENEYRKEKKVWKVFHSPLI